jgi:hypothetical protein
MRTDTSYTKVLRTMMWFMALLLVVVTAGCDREHGGATGTSGAGAAAVTSVIPVDIATGVCINKTVTATFSQPMLASTITATGTFTVKETISSSAVAGTVAYDATTMTATFTPSSNLTSGTNYTATITTAAMDTAGNPLAAAKVWSFTAGAAICAPSVNLGLASPFGIAATAGVTNTITAPLTHINGNVVLDPTATCNAVTVDNIGGFGLCGGSPPTINGQVITPTFPDLTTATNVKAALLAAFLSITPPAGPPAAGSLGGGTPIAAPTALGAVTGSALVVGQNLFYPGVYTSITSILVTDDLTLDAQGDPNARFVFQSASTVGTAAGAASPGVHTRILLINGAKASNVWWQAGTSATLGTFSEFQGNILASASITMTTGATSCGRLLAGAFAAGAFVFDTNVVSVPGHPNAPAGCQ